MNLEDKYNSDCRIIDSYWVIIHTKYVFWKVFPNKMLFGT